MKADTILCPENWDNEVFLRMCEAGITTELEQKLWDRLALICGLKSTGGISNEYAYSTRQDLINELEEVYAEKEDLEIEVHSLRLQIAELEDE